MKGNKKNEKKKDSPDDRLTFEEKYPLSYYYYTSAEIMEIRKIVKLELKKEKEKIEQELEKMIKKKKNLSREQIIVNLEKLISRKKEIEKEIEKLEEEERR